MKIPITREEGYHTNVLGTYTDGQYMGFAFFLEPYQKHLISALHLFDSAGNHLESKFWDSDDGSEVEVELEKAVAALPQNRPGNIAVLTFSVEWNQTVFGLISQSDDRIDYVPYGLAFFSPWDGTYET